MSNNQPPSFKTKHKKSKRKEQQSDNDVEVRKALQDLPYPPHLSQVNYLSIDSLETCIDDEITHRTYYEAIRENHHLFSGKIVLHITEGVNCLYSIFAAQANSKKVYCVINEKGEREVQNVAMMRELVKENQLENQIEVLLWKDFNSQVDIIIGEPMGYCLHLDGHLERILQARDSFLKSNGILFPNRLSFKCAAIHDEYFSDHKVNYWDDVYGIPMKSMKKWISHEPLIRVVDPALIVSKVASVLTFDLESTPIQKVKQIQQNLSVDLLGPCSANGLVFWFQAFFEHCTEKKQLKGSPWIDSTKFTQVTLYWPKVAEFKNGGRLSVLLKGKKETTQGVTAMSTAVNGEHYQYCFS